EDAVLAVALLPSQRHARAAGQAAGPGRRRTVGVRADRAVPAVRPAQVRAELLRRLDAPAAGQAAGPGRGRAVCRGARRPRPAEEAALAHAGELRCENARAVRQAAGSLRGGLARRVRARRVGPAEDAVQRRALLLRQVLADRPDRAGNAAGP